MRGGSEVYAVHAREYFTLDVRDEIAGWAARDDGHLVPRPADRRQGLHQLQFAAFVGAGQDLDGRSRLRLVAAGPRLPDLDGRRARAVELAPQRLRGVDVDLALGAGGAVGQELEAVLADFDRVA